MGTPVTVGNEDSMPISTVESRTSEPAKRPSREKQRHLLGIVARRIQQATPNYSTCSSHVAPQRLSQEQQTKSVAIPPSD